MARRFLHLLVIALLVLGAGMGVRALAKGEQSKAGEGIVNKLLAPGPLMLGHQNLEHGDCLKCHDAGQGVPNDKCLSCHTDIKKSINEKNSFHANNASKGCISCHSDHKGRNFNSTAVNQKTFDHSLTGFKLDGKHAKIACSTCHLEKRAAKPTRKSDIRFFGQQKDTCNECHKKDDVHFFPPKFAEKQCSTCHNTTSWKNAFGFDHKRDTGYALVGDHAKLKCATCHMPKGSKTPKYDFPQLNSQQCLTCHAKDNPHAGKFGAKFSGGQCDKCHTQTEWKILSFNHDITGFLLKGAHAKQPCVACHKQPPSVPKTNVKAFKFSGLQQSCVSCHKDYHGFKNETSAKQGPLNQCQSCHNEAAWRDSLRFNHNSDTAFPLDGKHLMNKCFDCHKPIGTSPQSGKSKNSKGFIDRIYDFPQLEAKSCETCHKNPHVGNPAPAFKQKCSTCHNTSGWMNLGGTNGGGAFNHNTQTKFPLTGDHATLKCNSCHLKGGKQVFKFPSADKEFCQDCHKSVHKGQFHEKFVGQACSDCHNTTTFKNQIFDHNTARFILTGEHAKIANKCVECHKPTKRMLPVKPPRPANKFIFGHAGQGFCVECHKNIHKDQFSKRFPADNCQQCHTTQSWKNLLDFDHDKTRFKLTGTHLRIKPKCNQCHKPTEKMLESDPPRPAGQFQFPGIEKGFCENCHTNVHKGQFSTEFSSKICLECHTTTNFTRRKPFDHSKTDFKIMGAHLKFKDTCAKCHTKTENMLATAPPKPASKFQFANKKTGFCESCHKDEHDGQFHQKFADEACKECHLQTTFAKKQKFDHALARFLIKGKHEDVKCGECHTRTKERYIEPPKRKKGKFIFENLYAKDCATCHKDPHDGRFGKRCSECHTEEGWDETAEYHKNFALHGVHFQLDCAECHTDKRRLQGMGDDCKMCHQKDDAHHGTQPECQTCHTQSFWSMTRFHHTMTDFPLRGAHRTLDCAACHDQGVYEGKDSNCISCHFGDAAKVVAPNHKTGGFEQCDTCHNQFSFQAAKPK